MMAIFQALIALFVYDAVSVFCPFRTIYSIVRGWPVARKRSEESALDRVCIAINYASVWYPKQILCLQRAFVMTCLLRKCGIAASMVLGAQKLPFKAHAWVEVDGHPINERSTVETTYTVWDRC
jgi:hypothetical protein